MKLAPLFLLVLLFIPGLGLSEKGECQQGDPYCETGEHDYYGDAVKDNPDRTEITEEEYKASEAGQPRTPDPDEVNAVDNIPKVTATDPETRKQQNEGRKNYLGSLGSDQKTGGFDTSYILTETIESFSDCLDYCIKGIQVRVDFNPTIDIIFTLYVQHNNADLIVQVYPRLNKSSGVFATGPLSDGDSQAPWKEWAKVMNEALYEGTESFVKDLYDVKSGGLGGGSIEGEQYGAHQAVNFKEADVVNNPFLVLPLLLDRYGEIEVRESNDGIDGCKTDGCLEQEGGELGQVAQEETDDRNDNNIQDDEAWPESEQLYEDAKEEVKESLDKYQGKAIDYKDKLVGCKDNPNNMVQDCSNEMLYFMDIMGVGKEFRRVFSVYTSAMEIVDTLRKVQKVIDLIVGIVRLIYGDVVSVSVKIDKILCASVKPGEGPEGDKMIPFMPQYLSGLDFFFWRGGLPWTDPHKTTTILNPLSKDRVGSDREIWGHIFPRTGFVDHAHDAKRGVVTAMRAMNIVQENPRKRMRKDSPGFGGFVTKSDAGKSGVRAWQMIYPHSPRKCQIRPDVNDSKNAMGDFMYPGKEQRYAFNYWRTHECGLTSKGSEIGVIEVPLGGDVGCQ